MSETVRCPWAGTEPIYIAYHDHEWGRPVHDDSKLFELLLLETMQAGLSWITVLKKRAAYREAFDGFNPQKIARYDNARVEALLQNKGIIRNRRKINAAVNNAQVFLRVQAEQGSFDRLIWSYVDGSPIINRWEKLEDIPATTPLSDRISRDLKRMGFQFIGSTTIYAFMQSAGMVNDHLTSCFAYAQCGGTRDCTICR